MGLLTDGENWLADLFTESESVSVTYTRGPHSITVAATRGRTDVPTFDSRGMETVYHSADYLIDAELLDFGEGTTEPEEDDAISDGSNTYRVSKIPGAECFRYSSPDRITLRIHTKLINRSI